MGNYPKENIIYSFFGLCPSANF